MNTHSVRRRGYKAIALLVVMLLAAACGDDGGSAEPAASTTTAGVAGTGTTASTVPKVEKVVGGKVTYAIGSDLTSFDPLKIAEGVTGANRAIQVFETLLRMVPGGQIGPGMAESLKSDDGLTWTLKLRPNIKFTDNTDYNADAVIYNINRQMDPANAYTFRSNVAVIETMTAVDALTVRFKLTAPNGSFATAFTSVNGLIASPTALKADLAGFAKNPVGAGPFVLKEWVKDDHMLLERNPGYWDKPKPYLDSVLIRILPDPQAWIDSLLSGAADVVSGTANTQANVKGKKDVSIVANSTTGGSFVVANQNHPTWKGGADIRFREAIAIAFDPAIVDQVLTRGAWDLKAPCPPFLPGGPECANLNPKFDSARAKSLIAEWVAAGNSPNVKLMSTVSVPQDNEFIQQELKRIGLNVTIDGVPTNEYTTRINGGNYELAWGAISSFADPLPKLVQYFHSKGGRWLGRKVNPAVDGALDKARDSLAQADKIAAYKTFQQEIEKDFTVSWYSPFISGLAVRKVDIGNWGGGTDYHIDEWSLVK